MTTSLLTRAATYVLAVAILLFVSRLKRLPLRATLGLYVPSAPNALLYSLLFIVLAAAGEWLAISLGAASVERWPTTTVATLIMRWITIVVLAPVAEELVFRGMFYTQIGKTRLGTLGAIAVPAVLFTAAHYDRGGAAILYVLTLVDGLYFGVVRRKTNSTLLTIALHSAGNAYAFLQRMP